MCKVVWLLRACEINQFRCWKFEVERRRRWLLFRGRGRAFSDRVSKQTTTIKSPGQSPPHYITVPHDCVNASHGIQRTLLRAPATSLSSADCRQSFISDTNRILFLLERQTLQQALHHLQARQRCIVEHTSQPTSSSSSAPGCAREPANHPV